MKPFDYETVLSSLGNNGVRTILLNRPEQLNAMNRALISDVVRSFDDANADSETRANAGFVLSLTETWGVGLKASFWDDVNIYQLNARLYFE